MRTSNTPGPWDACIDGAIRTKGHPLMIRARSCVVAEVVPQGSAEANARLIAAAPDLLAALRECVDFCKGHQESAARSFATQSDSPDGRACVAPRPTTATQSRFAPAVSARFAL